MASRPSDSSAARTKAQKQFTASEQRALTYREEMERERNARATKNNRLKALRLEKEAVDKAEALKRAAESPPAKPKRKSRSAPKTPA